MGTRAHDAEATRHAILDAAQAVFAAQGYHGARVDDIADQADVNKRMLYHYFGSKAGLYVAVVERMAERMVARLEACPADEADRDPLAALRTLLEEYHDLLVAEPQYAQLMLQEAAGGYRAIAAIERERGEVIAAGALEALYARLRPLIERGIAEGLLRPDIDPLLTLAAAGVAARSLLTMLPRLRVLDGRPHDTPNELDRARRALIDLLLYGMAALPPAEPTGARTEPDGG